jgi:hypothetical protein
MRFRIGALALTVSLASACGASSPESTPTTPAAAKVAPQPSSSSAVRLVFTGIEDGKGAGGLPACKLNYRLENTGSSALKQVTVTLRPVADPGDVNAIAFIETRGDLVIAMTNVDAGASRSSDRSFDAMSCDRVKAIRIASKTCGLKPSASCNDQLVIENETSLPLEGI